MTGGLFAILDDITILFDDIALMSKVAAKKTAGILGDDLAVNAEKATGFAASRELPVLWAITRGSFINKLIILPLAFLLSGYLPWLIVPVLLLGGAYLSYEGVEKIKHIFSSTKHNKPVAEYVVDEVKLVKIEGDKIKSAVRTDFILSVEIVVIALGTVMNKSLIVQILVVSLIAILATIGVYGLVAILVRMDDAGFYLIRKAQKRQGFYAPIQAWTGSVLVALLPWIIRALGIVGTIAMLLVGGGMFTHNIDTLHHWAEFMPALLADALAGIIVGGTLLGVHQAVTVLRR